MRASSRQPRLDIAALAAASMLAMAGLPAPNLGADDRPGSTAVISWEAPGDDGTTGVATRYQVRYRITPLLDGDTLTYWNAGTIVSGAPAPGWPGTTDSVVVTGLNPSVTYWFMVRAADEMSNWSDLSNIVEKPALPDQVAPAPIEDLTSTSQDALHSSAGRDTLRPSTQATPPGPR